MSIPGLNNTNLSEENLFDIPISLCPRHHKSLEDENWINLLAPSCRMSLGLHRFSRVRMQGWGLPKAMIRPMISYKRYDGIKLQSPRKIFCDLWRKEIRQIFIERPHFASIQPSNTLFITAVAAGKTCSVASSNEEAETRRSSTS